MSANFEIPEYLKTNITKALIDNGLSACNENIAIVFKDYDNNHCPHEYSVKYFKDVLIPITNDEKLAMALHGLQLFVNLKNDLYDESANDGEGRFDTWKSFDLNVAIATAEKVLSFK